MVIVENASLRKLNTFGFHSEARYFAEAENLSELREALSFARNVHVPVMTIGEGSNVVLMKSFRGMVIRLKMQEIEAGEDDLHHVLVKAEGGLVWDELVNYCLEHGYFGAENLTMIPGTVGAAPVQNIGAYGVELADIFHSLEAIEIRSGRKFLFSTKQCKFGYRDSVFKSLYKDRYVITSVTLRLSTRPLPSLRDHALLRELEALNIAPEAISPPAIAEIARTIRRRRLPDRNTLGNAGSFFVNPVVERAKYNAILEHFPNAPGFDISPHLVKLSAGWLIEQCGFKGTSWMGVGVYQHNPLVLVNFSRKYASSILELSQQIKKTVFDIFGVPLVMEPPIYGQDLPL